MRTCGGTMIPASTRPWSSRLPRKSVRVNPYAAIAQVTTVSRVVMTEMYAEFMSQTIRSPDSQTLPYASKVTREPVQENGVLVVSPSGFREVATAQASGRSQAAVSSRATTSRAILPGVQSGPRPPASADRPEPGARRVVKVAEPLTSRPPQLGAG